MNAVVEGVFQHHSSKPLGRINTENYFSKLEITFWCPFSEQCAEHGNDPAAISPERANLTLSCFHDGSIPPNGTNCPKRQTSHHSPAFPVYTLCFQACVL